MKVHKQLHCGAARELHGPLDRSCCRVTDLSMQVCQHELVCGQTCIFCTWGGLDVGMCMPQAQQPATGNKSTLQGTKHGASAQGKATPVQIWRTGYRFCWVCSAAFLQWMCTCGWRPISASLSWSGTRQPNKHRSSKPGRASSSSATCRQTAACAWLSLR